MKYKTLCRLLVRLLGVYFLATGIAAIWQAVIQVAEYLSQSVTISAGRLWYVGVILYPIADIVIGAYLFWGGKWIVDKLVPSNRPYCHECGYDLTGASGNICAECGTPFKPVTVAEPDH